MDQYLLLGFSTECREVLFSSYIDYTFYVQDKIPENMCKLHRLHFLQIVLNLLLISYALQYLLFNVPDKDNRGYFLFLISFKTFVLKRRGGGGTLWEVITWHS